MDSSDHREPRGEPASVWLETTGTTDYDALDEDTEVDIAVLGGGIAGITTAAELVSAGRSVAVVERDRIVESVTGHTTAKLTSLHGLRYDHLLEQFGEDRARQYAEANQWAIDHVESTAAGHDIDCEFERRPAYTYAPGDRERIEDEVAAAQRLDLPASLEESTDLPFETGAAVRFESQAQFHPREYLLGLAETLTDGDGRIFEQTTATDVEDGSPCTVSTDGGTITAGAVVVATHYPVADEARYYQRLSPKRSYVLAVRLDEDVPDGMYYSSGEPYFSVRPSPAGNAGMALVGGQNHRTGHGGTTTDRYRDLERQARNRFDVESIEYRWATQDYTSVDRVPFVGVAAPQVSDIYVATGFGGWGMTNGTAAGLLLADLVRGRDNPWTDVYDPTRFEFGASKSDLVEHNKHAMKHLFEGYVESHPGLDLSGLDRGEALVADERDDPVAAYRDGDGQVHAVSAVCPHMGCLVTWNDGEESWDCPCHGSRFDVDGSVLDTPAIDDLDTVDVSTPDR